MIYMDNAASTPLSDAAKAAMEPYLQDVCGNATAIHSQGQRAAAAIMDARARVAKCLGCAPEQVEFTSCGTEADVQALMSLAFRAADERARRAKGAHADDGRPSGPEAFGGQAGRRRIVTFAFEHHAIARTCERLSRMGFDVDVLDVGPSGVVDPDQVADRLGDDVAMVAVMAVNNEVGTVQPVREIARTCAQAGVLCHTDAVQAAGHIPLDFSDLGVSTMALSSHKFHGPKGVGVLVHRDDACVEPLLLGGGQERGLRSGTPNTPGIVGTAVALEEACGRMEEESKAEWRLNDQLVEGLSAIPDARLTGTSDKGKRVPGIVHFCFKGVDAQTLLMHLDAHGVCASAGSSCASGAVVESDTLTTMGVPPEWARGALRLSFDSTVGEHDVARVVKLVAEGVRMQRSVA